MNVWIYFTLVGLSVGAIAAMYSIWADGIAIEERKFRFLIFIVLVIYTALGITAIGLRGWLV